MPTKRLTQEALQALVHYDPQTGVFRRRNLDGTLKPGPYGCADKTRGYICMGFADYGTHRAHRLAWLYVYGEWPVVVDHINGDKQDNRIANLRNVDQATNMQNLSRTAGRGAYRWRNRWRAIFGGKHLGMFDTRDEAEQAYLDAKIAMHAGYVHMPHK